MGILCQKEESVNRPKSNKCSQCSKYSGREHLRTFETCSHLICQQCLSMIGNTNYSCPMTHKKPNIVLEMGRNLYNSIRNSNEEIQIQLCSKKHRMIWKDEFQVCNICHIHMHGFKCRICNQFICTLCAQSFDPKKQKCPNKHSMVWRSSNIPCLICGTKKHGWTCRQCRWYACSECCQTRFNSSGCPNLHSLLWNFNKQVCTICKQKQRCFECKSCISHYCFKCVDYRFDRRQCPNKHLTHLVQKHTCTKCDLQMPGMLCEQCNYHFCTRCDLQKYSTNTKPQQQAYHSIRIVIQNPLLQFQQFQRKSSVNAMKEAAQKHITNQEILKNSCNHINIKINEAYNSQCNQSQNQNQSQKYNQKQNKNQNQKQQQKEEQKQIIEQKDIGKQKGKECSIQQLKQQLLQHPQKIDLYFKLADAYGLEQNYINQIRMYQQAWDAEDQKQDKDVIVLCKIGERGLSRTTTLKYRKSSIIFLNKLIQMAEKCWNSQIQNKKCRWEYQRIEALLLSKQTEIARQQFMKMNAGDEQYERIKNLFSNLES